MCPTLCPPSCAGRPRRPPALSPGRARISSAGDEMATVLEKTRIDGLVARGAPTAPPVGYPRLGEPRPCLSAGRADPRVVRRPRPERPGAHNFQKAGPSSALQCPTFLKICADQSDKEIVSPGAAYALTRLGARGPGSSEWAAGPGLSTADNGSRVQQSAAACGWVRKMPGTASMSSSRIRSAPSARAEAVPVPDLKPIVVAAVPAVPSPATKTAPLASSCTQPQCQRTRWLVRRVVVASFLVCLPRFQPARAAHYL